MKSGFMFEEYFERIDKKLDEHQKKIDEHFDNLMKIIRKED